MEIQRETVEAQSPGAAAQAHIVVVARNLVGLDGLVAHFLTAQPSAIAARYRIIRSCR